MPILSNFPSGSAHLQDQIEDLDNATLKKTGGDMTGAINMNGQPISGLNDPTEDTQAARKGYVDASARKAAPRNLLDNSDFTNPVNQRGKTSYNETGYTIDRWYTNMGVYATVTVGNGKITLHKSNSGGDIMQTLPVNLTGKTMTYAVMTADGNIWCKSAVISDSFSFTQIAGLQAYLGIGVVDGQTVFRIYFNDSSDITLELVWAALYEGSYTAETLPEYHPKGYGAELAECQRYYQAFLNNAFLGTVVVDIDGVNFQGSIPCGEMRVRAPTIIGSIAAWDGLAATAVSSVTAFKSQGNGMRINGSFSRNVTQGKFLILYAATEVAFSADL